MGRQPRQRPISCVLCRTRKLRCSRTFPCSNCTTRGITCQHDAAPPSAGIAPVAPAKAAVTNGGLSNAEMLARLERLEALVAAQTKVPSVTPIQPPPPHQVQGASTPSYPASTLHTSQSPADTLPMPPKIQRLTADALWLERSCSGQKLLDSLVTDPIVFRTCPIRLITKPSSFIFPSASSSSLPDLPSEPTKCIWLPQRQEAHALVEKYINDITHLNHIIHVPSIRTLIKDMYSALDQGVRVDLGALVLLLSICTSTTYSWTPRDNAQCLFSNHKQANAQAISWLKATLDVIDHAHRITHASLECIQGMIALFFVMCNFEGISQRSRALVFKSIGMARELALHRIDYRDNSVVEESIRVSTVKTEVARRVWWHLSATDWMLAQFSVPQEGTYTIQPGHSTVKMPLNANDDDIVEGKPSIGRPMGEATVTSYLLERIRLAETCRDLLDDSPNNLMINCDGMDYGQVMEVDAKLNQFIREIPGYFSFENADWKRLLPTDPWLSAGIIIQRYTLNLLIHRQLCKLHLPYLARGTVEPAFAYSRDACLQSARCIIHAEREVRMEQSCSFSTNLRLAMVLRSVFLASIALFLDACLRSDADTGFGYTDETIQAWRILEEAQDQSPTAAKLLELSIQVLRKHKATHPALNSLPKQGLEILSPGNRTLPMTPDSADRTAIGAGMVPHPGASGSETAYLEQQWQALEGRMDLDAVDWERLFWGLDAPLDAPFI